MHPSWASSLVCWQKAKAKVFFFHRELDGVSYAEEVLVTKSELEEKKQRMSELETQASPYARMSVPS